MIEEQRKPWSVSWLGFTSQVSRRPLIWYAGYLVFELCLLSVIPHDILSNSVAARTYVDAIAGLSPVIHRFDNTAKSPEVISFFLAISALLIVPKVMFFVGWLRSDKFGVYRYFVISPLTCSVPKSALDFVKDAGLAEREIPVERRMSAISMRRRVFQSVFMLILAATLGILGPWVIFGRNPLPGPMEADAAQGGWKLWTAWSVYMMTFSAIFLAIAYCILVEYFRWGRNLMSGWARK